jgi:hypothetical protein
MSRGVRGDRRRRPGFLPSAGRAGAALGMVVASIVLYGALTAPAFALRNIEVSPLRWTDRAALMARLGLTEGMNAFQFRTDGLAARLAGLPAVLAASVRVALPDALVVSVTERTPILAWRIGDATFLVDRDGEILAAAATADDAAGLPVVIDAREASRFLLVVGRQIDPVDLDAATRLASLTPADVGTTAAGLVLRITDADGFVLTTSPASWTAVFGPYGLGLRSPELIPGQVRLLRSLLFGRETEIARVVLADDQNGTYLPVPSAR